MAAEPQVDSVNASPAELRQRVIDERGARSVRSVTGGLVTHKLTNTRWSAWENGSAPLTRGVILAVAEAFDWPEDWPINPPAAPIGALEKLQVQVTRLTEAVEEMQGMLRQLLER